MNWKLKWMSRVSGQVEVDGGKMVWKLLARPSTQYAAEVCLTGGRSACRKLGLPQMKIGRRLLGESNRVAGVAVQGDLGSRKPEGRDEGGAW